MLACDISTCPPVVLPTCTGQNVPVVITNGCCETYECQCPDNCPSPPEPTDPNAVPETIPGECCETIVYGMSSIITKISQINYNKKCI